MGQGEGEHLTSVCRISIQELETNRNSFPNPGYRNEKLKAQLEIHNNHKSIAFVNVHLGGKGFITYNLLYSANIPVANVVAYALNLRSKGDCEDVTSPLRSTIQRALNDLTSLIPWHHTAKICCPVLRPGMVFTQVL